MASESPAALDLAPETLREAENALARLGFAKIPPVVRDAPAPPEFWVQESGVPRRAFPVFVEHGPDSGQVPGYVRWATSSPDRKAAPARAIVVVPNEAVAQRTWERVRGRTEDTIESELAILVLPGSSGPRLPHWHRGVVGPRTLLRLATGIAVGLFQRAQASEGSSQVDFHEMLEILKNRYQVDIAASLGVQTDEDALFILYQLAVRDSYAPGDPGSSLHLLVLKPTGPAARLPWFAA